MTQSTANPNRIPIGKVLRASTQQFVFGTKVPKSDVPIFGSLVKTTIQYQNATIYGLIFNIEIQDDGMTKMLSVADDVSQEDRVAAQSACAGGSKRVVCGLSARWPTDAL